MSEDYTPIDCHLYSEYELAILRGWTLRLAWKAEDGTSHIEVITPRDLETREHAEYLVAEAGDGRQLKIRLDRISDMRRAEDSSDPRRSD